MGVWCNGSIPVSKTVGQGSNPCAPATNNLEFFILKGKILYDRRNYNGGIVN